MCYSNIAMTERVVSGQILLQGMEYAERLTLCRLKQYYCVAAVCLNEEEIGLQHAAHVATSSNTNHRISKVFLMQ